MTALTVLVPIYNEAHWFSSGGFTSNWGTMLSAEALAVFRSYAKNGCSLDLRFCLWPSQDDSLVSSTLARYISQLPSTVSAQIVVANRIPAIELNRPSVVASLELGLSQKVTSPLVMVCPIDCALKPAGWAEVLEFAQKATAVSARRKPQHHWAVFPKRYAGVPPSLPLKCSAWIQNQIIGPILGIHCWTNLFVVPTAALALAFRRYGFLEDLRANKKLLRQYGRPHRFDSCASVSPRRYLRRGPLTQMRINISIYLRYVFGRYDSTAADLRRLHDGTETDATATAQGSHPPLEAIRE
jgi:hypothetical protein